MNTMGKTQAEHLHKCKNNTEPTNTMGPLKIGEKTAHHTFIIVANNLHVLLWCQIYIINSTPSGFDRD